MVELQLIQFILINRTLLIVSQFFGSNVFIFFYFLRRSNQALFHGRRPVIISLIWLLFFKRNKVIFIIPFATVLGLSWSVLLVPHWSITVLVLFGRSVWPAGHRACHTKIDCLRKYFFPKFGYLLRPTRWSV